MKELIIFAICISLLASLSACTGQPEGTASAAESAASTAEPAASATEPVSQANASIARYDERYRHVQGFAIGEDDFILKQFDTCGHEFFYETREDGVYISHGAGIMEGVLYEETDGILYMPETVDGLPVMDYGEAKNYHCQRIRFPNFEGSGGGFSTSTIGVWEIAAHEKELFNDRVVVGRYEVSPDNPYLCDIDGVLFSKDKTVLLDLPEGYENIRYTIPDTVVEIADDAFDLREATGGIQEILVPPSVTKFPEEWPGEGGMFSDITTIYVAPGSAAQAYFERVLAQKGESIQLQFQLVLREFQAE